MVLFRNITWVLSPLHCSALTLLIAPLSAFITRCGARASAPSLEEAGLLLVACLPVTHLLVRLLHLVETGSLVLQEADALRLVAAGSLPFVAHVRLLRRIAAPPAPGLHPAGPPAAQYPAEVLAQMLGPCCVCAMAMFRVAVQEGACMPPRVVAVARATSLRPAALLQWLLDVAAVATYLGETLKQAAVAAAWAWADS